MSSKRQSFRDAVERLYSVFARYPLRPDTEACTCCHEPGDEALLHAKPLRELSAKDLDKYSWSAIWTWGDTGDFKHFLPRLFELLADGSSFEWMADTEVIVSKLRHGVWRDWPAEEQNAVSDYLGALWRLSVSGVEDITDVEGVLCAIGQAVDDMTPYLDEWVSAGLVGHHRLASFIVDEAGTIAKHWKLSDAFWTDKRAAEHESGNDRTAQMKQVIDWLFSRRTKDALETTFLEHSSDPLAKDIATAVDTLEYLTALQATRRGSDETNNP